MNEMRKLMEAIEAVDDTDGLLVSDEVHAKIKADLTKMLPGYEPGGYGKPEDGDNQVSVLAWNPATGHEIDLVFNFDTMSIEGSEDHFNLSNPFESLEEAEDMFAYDLEAAASLDKSQKERIYTVWYADNFGNEYEIEENLTKDEALVVVKRQLTKYFDKEFSSDDAYVLHTKGSNVWRLVDPGNFGMRWEIEKDDGLYEAEEDRWAGNFAAYEEPEKWIGQTVEIESAVNDAYVGETGKVVNAEKDGLEGYRYTIKLYSGPVIELWPSEWSHDQFKLKYDPTHRPDGKYNPALEEAKGRVVEVPPELRGDIELVGNATSADAEKFLADLGPDDDVSHDVVDPETGELLDWPSKGLSRDEPEDDWYRQHGGTKRQKAKRELKNKEQDRGPDLPPIILGAYGTVSGYQDDQEIAWGVIDEFRNSDFYNVVWRNAADLVGTPADLGVPDAEDFGDLDYDVDVEVPVAIKRKDGERFTDDDHDNFRELVKATKKASTMGNFGVSYVGTSDNGTVARFTPSFM